MMHTNTDITTKKSRNTLAALVKASPSRFILLFNWATEFDHHHHFHASGANVVASLANTLARKRAREQNIICFFL